MNDTQSVLRKVKQGFQTMRKGFRSSILEMQ
jgi:hypothetical protein